MPPIHIMIKPASGLCNMRCRYCFYEDEMRNRKQASYGMMSEQTLENVISKAFDYADTEVTFAFQGGEPTLRGLPFFRKAVELQKKYNQKDLLVNNALQTNGYCLDEEWCQFFHENHFLLGLSIDGTMQTHDKNRLDADGKGTFLKCMETAGLFRKYQVEFNILTVVNRHTAPKIRRIYQEYNKRGFRYQQYIACLDPLFEEAGRQDYSLTPAMYGDFLVELFQLWFDDLQQNRQPFIRQFENYIGILMGRRPESCEQNGRCTCQSVVEADGSVYPCDFYMLDQYRLGNLHSNSFEDIAQRGIQIQFAEQSENQSETCKNCQYFTICRGGCNRHRYAPIVGGAFENYFCEAYRRLFDAHYDKMMWIAQSILRSR